MTDLRSDSRRSPEKLLTSELGRFEPFGRRDLDRGKLPELANSATLWVATAMSETRPKADVQVKTTYEYTAQLNVDVFDESGVFLDEGEA